MVSIEVARIPLLMTFSIYIACHQPRTHALQGSWLRRRSAGWHGHRSTTCAYSLSLIGHLHQLKMQPVDTQVLNFGSDKLKQEIVPDVFAGKKFISLAISEAFAGSDVAGLR